MIVLLCMLMLLSAAAAPAAETGAHLAENIRHTRLDPEQCYRVRDLFFEREDLKFYLTDGLLIFAEPTNGSTVAALFVADEPADTGEIILVPPNRRERQSLARFISEPVLDEKFRTALMVFTDDNPRCGE